MQIGWTGSTATQCGTYPHKQERAAGVPASPSMAIIPVNNVSQTRERPRPSALRPNAAFVAHLIAVAVDAPQTRTLRRMSADETMATYRDAQGIALGSTGKIVSQSV